MLSPNDCLSSRAKSLSHGVASIVAGGFGGGAAGLGGAGFGGTGLAASAAGFSGGPAASLPGGGAASEPPGFCSSAIANSLGRLLHLSPAGTGCQIAQVGQTIAFCRLSPRALQLLRCRGTSRATLAYTRVEKRYELVRRRSRWSDCDFPRFRHPPGVLSFRFRLSRDRPRVPGRRMVISLESGGLSNRIRLGHLRQRGDWVPAGTVVQARRAAMAG